jgi:LPS export ABC transporter permease LptG
MSVPPRGSGWVLAAIITLAAIQPTRYRVVALTFKVFKFNFRFGRLLVPRYVLGATLPYTLLSLLLLTSILFAQQAGRLAEVILYTDLPASLLGNIAVTLLPGVLVFTIPLAILAGTIVGFSRMGTDSEIIALRAAGIGSWTLIWPILLLGLVATAFTFHIHLNEAPQAARDLERVALQGALAKLDSPVEPRTFSTLPRYVIYVRDGDNAQGAWGRVFIYAQQKDQTEIFTARSGRIDSSGEQSELVLTDVLSAKFPTAESKDPTSYVVERSDQLRISINTGRADIIQRLNERDVNADTMDWNDLRTRVETGTAVQKREALRILNRRTALALAPLVFSLIGVALGLRVRRGGRGLGVLISLVVVVIYYLISLLGESLSRVGTVSPYIGPWAATAFLLVVSFLFLFINRLPGASLGRLFRFRSGNAKSPAITRAKRTIGIGNWAFPNLMDASLLRTLALSFLVGFVALASLFNIFTLFELWRFIAVSQAGATLVARYLLFLLPLISVEMFPATMLIAVLITYALLARRHEAIAWWASGQSVYRLMLPGVIFAIGMAAGSWLIQEHLMPGANLRQDALRARIRGGEARAITGTGRQWLASTETRRFYSYEFQENGTLKDLTIYELDQEAVHLSKVVSGKTAIWTDPNHLLMSETETLALNEMEVVRLVGPQVSFSGVDPPSVFKPSVDKPSQLSAKALNNYVKAAKQRDEDVSALSVALQRKYSGPFSIVIMAFIGMPLALSFGRKGTVIALCAAVAVSVAYWAVGGGFQQLGNHGLLRPAVAGWSPLLIFTAAGTYFLSRVRT